MNNEVITLQFGNYSNFVCSHFWNIQESQFIYRDDKVNIHDLPDVNHDILFREGIDSKNQITFTPRTILFDLKENINIMRVVDSKRKHEANTNLNWSGQTQVYKQKKNETSQFINNLDKLEMLEEIEHKNGGKPSYPLFSNEELEMEKQVKYWPDYLKMRLDENSIIGINQHQVASNDDTDPFGLFHYGLNASKEDHLLDLFENQLRRYSEECSNIQGFHLFLDSFNGFGGLAANFLDFVKEEYAKRSIFSILSFPDFKNQTKEIQMIELINTAFSIKSLVEDNKNLILLPLSLNESFYMEANEIKPVKLPLLNYKSELNYHTSAILASLADCVTTPWRQKSQVNHISDFVNFFDSYNYKLTSLQSIYPFEINTDKYLFNYLQENDLCSNATWFTPSITDHVDKTVESTSHLTGVFSVTCKGIEEERVKNKNDTFVFRETVPAHVVLERYFTEMYPKSINKCFSTRTGLNIRQPFPNIINLDSKLPKKAKKNPSVSLLTMLQMNKSIIHLCDHISTNLNKCNANKLVKYHECGMEYEDFQDLVQFNRNLTESFSN